MSRFYILISNLCKCHSVFNGTGKKSYRGQDQLLLLMKQLVHFPASDFTSRLTKEEDAWSSKPVSDFVLIDDSFCCSLQIEPDERAWLVFVKEI